MDYFEGLCLGARWSDTDYSNRRHLASFFFLGLTVCTIVFLYWIGGYFSFLTVGDFETKLGVLIALFILSPFLSFRYHRMPIFVKIPILLLQGSKYLLVLAVVSAYYVPMINISFPDAQMLIIEFINKTLEDSVNNFSESTGSFSTILGVIVGGLYFVLLFLGIFFVALLIPGLIVLTYRLLQYGYDSLMARFVLKRFMDR